MCFSGFLIETRKYFLYTPSLRRYPSIAGFFWEWVFGTLVDVLLGDLGRYISKNANKCFFVKFSRYLYQDHRKEGSSPSGLGRRIPRPPMYILNEGSRVKELFSGPG